MVTHNPLHGSGRAVLPHPASALGDDAQAHERLLHSVGIPKGPLPAQRGMDFAAQYPACTCPCQRFALALASDDA